MRHWALTLAADQIQETRPFSFEYVFDAPVVEQRPEPGDVLWTLIWDERSLRLYARTVVETMSRLEEGPWEGRYLCGGCPEASERFCPSRSGSLTLIASEIESRPPHLGRVELLREATGAEWEGKAKSFTWTIVDGVSWASGIWRSADLQDQPELDVGAALARRVVWLRSNQFKQDVPRSSRFPRDWDPFLCAGVQWMEACLGRADPRVRQAAKDWSGVGPGEAEESAPAPDRLAVSGRVEGAYVIRPTDPTLLVARTFRAPIDGLSADALLQSTARLERAEGRHQEIVREMATFALSRDCDIFDSVAIDLLVRDGSKEVVCEVKTLHSDNYRSQVRHGLAQLLEARYFLGLASRREQVLCLVLDLFPSLSEVERSTQTLFLASCGVWALWYDDRSGWPSRLPGFQDLLSYCQGLGCRPQAPT